MGVSEEFQALADRVFASAEPDRELDRDIEIAIQNQEGQGYEDPRDNIRAQKVSIPHGARPEIYEGVTFSGISYHTPRYYTGSFDDALKAIPDGLILRRYVATNLVPHSCEVSRGPGFGGWNGHSDHSMTLSLLHAAMLARASLGRQLAAEGR